ncbi:hypothetical protein [Streptomyces sp. DG2A-72]|uniref:hypothetical protein n=1 Tax=Streptomyces sp. DG2A-72 TaxID=3051386 RepID=UPI003464669E
MQDFDDGLEKESEAWEYVSELSRRESEPLVHKSYGAAETDACIRSTIHGAFVRRYDVTLVADAHTAPDNSAWGAPPPEQVIAHTNLYWRHQSAPGRKAGVTATQDVRFDDAS